MWYSHFPYVYSILQIAVIFRTASKTEFNKAQTTGTICIHREILVLVCVSVHFLQTE